MKKHKRWLIGTLLKIFDAFLILCSFASFDVLYGVLFGFLFMFGIAAWELRLFTRKDAYMREFMPDWLKYLVQGGIFALIDAVLLLFRNVFVSTAFTDMVLDALENANASNEIVFLVYMAQRGFVVLLICELLCLLLTLIVGGSKTMLFRDRHGLKGK